MPVSLPQLDVYYIEFADKENITKQNTFERSLSMAAKGLSSAAKYHSGLLDFAFYALVVLGVSLTPGIIKSLRRLIDEKKFYIISSPEELSFFENAYGNEWVTNQKALKQKQYYIRHPKKVKRNILVEAKSFYDYIEEEQKDELIDYILSHCPAKTIQIERAEAVHTKGKVSAKIDRVNAQGSVHGGQAVDFSYNYSNPKGIQATPSYDYYVWLNDSIMRSISALAEGGSLTQTYESDYTFGLNVGEAKTIGLDLSKHKKYTYSIHIKC